MSLAVFLLSIAANLATILFAVRLIRLTGQRLVWGLVAATFAIAIAHRVIVSGPSLHVQHLSGAVSFTDLVSLGIAVALAVSLYLITVFVKRLFSSQETLRQSDDELRMFFNEATDGIIVLSPDLKVCDINRQLTELLGYSREEALGRPVTEFLSPDELARLPLRIEDIRQQRILRTNRRVIHRDGSLVDVEISTSRLHDGRYIGQVRDLRYRREAERKIAFQANLLNSVQQAVAAFDAEHRIIYFNSYAAQLYGWDKSVMGTAILQAVVMPGSSGDWLQELATIDASLRRGETWSGEKQVRTLAGTERDVYITQSPVYDSNTGEYIGSVGVSFDLTEKKRAERELRDGQRMVSYIAESTPSMLYIFDIKERRNKYTNHSIAEFLGYPGSELEGTDQDFLTRVLHPEDLPLLLQHFERLAQVDDTDILEFEYRMRHKDGGWRWFFSRDRVFRRDEQGVPVEIVGTATDITAMKENEFKLQQSEEGYRSVIEAAAIIIVGLSGDYVISEWNPEAELVLGRTRAEALGKSFPSEVVPDSMHSVLVDALQSVNAGHQVRNFECRVWSADGNLRLISWNLTRLAGGATGATQYVLLGHDITDQRRVQNDIRDSEERFRTLADSASVLMWLAATDGACTFFNQSWLTFRGRTLEQEQGDGWTEGVHPDDLPHCLADYRRAVANRQPFELLYRLRRFDGEYRWILDRGVPGLAGEVCFGFIGSALDITERQQASEKIAFQSRMLDQVSDAFIAIDRNNCITYCNDSAAALYRLDRDQILGKPLTDFIKYEWATPEEEAATWAALKQHGHWHGQNIHRTADGRVLTVESAVSVLRDAQGKSTGLMAAIRDVTQRREVERTLHETLQTSADIVAAIPAGLYIYEFQPPDQLLLREANPEAKRLTGVDIERERGKEFNELWPNARERGITQAFLKVVRTGENLHLEDLSYADDRLTGAFRVNAFTLPGNRLGVAFEDITERKRASNALQESELRFRLLFQEAPIPYQSLDENGRILTVNRAWLESLGYASSDVVGHWFGEFLHPDSLPTFRAGFPQFKERGRVDGIEFDMLHKDGSLLHVSFAGRIGFDENGRFRQTHCVFIDQTKDQEYHRQRVLLERQLRQAQRLESIGMLAAGIAHDFNNLLVPVVGYAELLHDGLRHSPEQSAYAREVLKAGYRSRDLVAQLLAFSRRQAVDDEIIDWELLVETSLQAFEFPRMAAAGNGSSPAPNRLQVQGSAEQLGQIVTTLADFALEITGGVAPSFHLVNIPQEISYCAGCSRPLVGQQARLEFHCPGVKIGELDCRNLFTTFPSAENPDRPNDLALAVAHGLAVQHGGHLCAQSLETDRMLICLYVPVNTVLAPKRVEISERPRYNVLIIDNKQTAAQTIAWTLERFGCTAHIALSFAEGAELLRQSATGFDLAIVDDELADTSETAALQRLRNIQPDLSVALCSSLGDSGTTPPPGALALLPKPVTSPDIEHLLELLHQQRVGQMGAADFAAPLSSALPS